MIDCLLSMQAIRLTQLRTIDSQLLRRPANKEAERQQLLHCCVHTVPSASWLIWSICYSHHDTVFDLLDV